MPRHTQTQIQIQLSHFALFGSFGKDTNLIFGTPQAQTQIHTHAHT